MPQKQKAKRPKNSRGVPRGLRHSINWLSSEFGVGAKELVRKLEAQGIDCSNGVTIRRAFEAEVDRASGKKNRERLLLSEANMAEMDEAEKAGTLMKKTDCHRLIAELAVETRKALEGADYIPKASRVRLSKELGKIKV